MAALVVDPVLEEHLIAQRKAWGADKYDEVWDGLYIMTPAPNNEHQLLRKDLVAVLTLASIGRGWRRCIQVPTSATAKKIGNTTIAVRISPFTNETQAKNCTTHWRGGPCLAIEIVSSNDRTPEKLPFYARIGTREVLLIDRDPWQQTLYRLAEGGLREVGR